jgi:hypothetical protein
MVGIVAAVRGQVESYAEALLSGRQGLAVESIRLFSGGKTRILPDGPGSLGVHRGVGPAGVGVDTRPGFGPDFFHRNIVGGIQWLDADSIDISF